MDTFRFRLNCIDHYQSAPTELDPVLRRGTGLSQRQNGPQVPVIRAFGATETGQKVCAHIHGALPYLYLQYDGNLEHDAVNEYIHTLRDSIDHALAVSYRRNAYDGRSVYVGHITLVKGVPFFGYHVGYKFYLKVYMLNPMHMTRFADLLYQGAIMNRVLQPHESHMQYLLQWMCDYNLYGCAYIDCSKVTFRSPVPDCSDSTASGHKWHDKSIPGHLFSDQDRFPRQSHCSIEVDICVQDILNRKDIEPRPQHHDFIERFRHLQPDEKLVHSMAGLWRDETRRRRLRMGLSESSGTPFPPEVLVSVSADPRNTDKGGWIHEEEFNEMIQELIHGEKEQKPDADMSFDKFVKPVRLEDLVQTAIESVEDLFPENLQRAVNLPEEIVEDIDDLVNDDIAAEAAFGQRKPELGGIDDSLKAADEVNDIDDKEQDDLEDEGSAEAETSANSDLYPVTSSGAHTALRSDSSHESSKKRESPPASTHPNKRLKISPETPLKSAHLLSGGVAIRTGSTRRVTFQDALGENRNSDMPVSTSQKSVEEGGPQSSQGSIKALGGTTPKTLSFPVVKNPHDSGTLLRLSQEGYSNTQKTPKRTAAAKLALPNSSEDSPRTPWSHQRTPSTVTTTNRKLPPSEMATLAAQLGTSCYCRKSSRVLYYGGLPPVADVILSTMSEYGMPSVIYQDAFYSDENDVPDRSREYAGREFKLESTTIPYLPAFDPTGTALSNFGEKPAIVLNRTKEEQDSRARAKFCKLRNWELATAPPSVVEVGAWLQQEKKDRVPSTKGSPANRVTDVKSPSKKLSQIEGPTQKNKGGFKYSQKKKSASVKHETQYMSIMSLEVHVNNRGTLAPDPNEDEISCVFWCIDADDNAGDNRDRIGIVTLSDEDGIAKRIAKQVSVEVEYEEDELDLINKLVDIVREFDPDILTGYEVHNGSWGYLIERARLKYEYDLCDEFSRMKSQSHGRFGKDADRWGFTHTSTIKVTGRHMINIWRAMRGELNLLQYTMENVVFHLLHKRIPHYSFRDLTSWYRSSRPRDLAKILDYFLSRVQLNLEILEVNELVSRTSEQARLLGVDFFSVFSRGSQFKVESLMFRIAKPESFILVSPSRKQVGQQNALECLPLVMEPQSAFYTSPLLVLDFQSLYPSVMIAYNYCYSTCLGRVVSWRGQNKMGFADFQREPRLLELIKDYINIAPNGMMYVKPEMRKSLLAKMLGEILETRVMVKSGMKADKGDKSLQQLLNNRQLALKLIANVTYGYTSASFSGRMPCSEIADSIVQTGREILEKAIALIHSVDRWGAEVVYGDTDSLFVYLKGRTRDQAFAIGEEIAEAVTNANPRPVKLKFEKVYHPCVLLAKKRYVGFKYESRTQTTPDFDAKGIETVRRDGTPAEQKIEEKALKILFRSADLSAVKSYFQSQCAKIMTGSVSIQDFLFAKEVKLGTYSDKGPPPPGALIATKRMLADPRLEPQYGERVPYVVVTGAPQARLIDRCVAPEALLADDALELDAEYYISKNLIPPLERIFNLVGANVRLWYEEMPKVQRIRSVGVVVGANEDAQGGGAAGMRKTLENYMKSSACLVCRTKLSPLPPQQQHHAEEPSPVLLLPLCEACKAKPAQTLLALRMRLNRAETRVQSVEDVCRSCAGLSFGEEVRCDSRDCPVFYTRLREKARADRVRDGVGSVVGLLEKDGEESFIRGGGALEW
ncbi:DNA polymeras-like protein zeta catalytic subunit [Lophium mytilinum]|uniref:DNA polymerase n=1 Tax=Lophium mytilinum TaxID=390894 RepID=A0A6A6QA75_9PEZI|nr:DNA polymeras-like protein zeta catalytic subunit [Lophium mytilinum]